MRDNEGPNEKGPHSSVLHPTFPNKPGLKQWSLSIKATYRVLCYFIAFHLHLHDAQISDLPLRILAAYSRD